MQYFQQSFANNSLLAFVSSAGRESWAKQTYASSFEDRIRVLVVNLPLLLPFTSTLLCSIVLDSLH